MDVDSIANKCEEAEGHGLNVGCHVVSYTSCNWQKAEST